MQRNIWKARVVWNKFKKILVREGASHRVMGYFYKVVIQAILLYGSESWVVTNKCLQRRNSFHHRVACSITGMYGHPDLNDPERWVYPDMDEVLDKVGLFEVEVYIERRRQSVFHNYVTGHSPWFRRCVNQLTTVGNCKKKTWWSYVM